MLTPLLTPELRARHIPEPWSYGLADTVRFYELDALNHVNNVAYLKWFETIRVRYLIDYGISTYGHGPDDPTLVVRALTADYRAPMFQNENYVVTARTAKMGRTSFTMEYAVFAPDLRATGTCVVVHLTSDGKAKAPLSETMRETFRTRDGAESA